MGCCYSSENKDSDQDREEWKLLLDPSIEPNYHSLPSARTDEMLSSILAKTASNIIDVSAADSQGMEQHEYMDLARQYKCSHTYKHTLYKTRFYFSLTFH
uniref:Ragulator complex protein LAMTOR1 n=1 Tax=Ictidomys tridecemlineatus TaxID=43179 RepID=A0A287CRX4_ICTTR